MQTFVVAPSALEKALTWVRPLIEPIHDKIRSEVKEAMKTYRREKGCLRPLGKERKNQEAPVLPPNRMFLISGNNTGTGIPQNIMDSNGTGIICESEADTVSTAIGTEYGNWSDTLRKAFDHDRLSYNRRTDREYQEVSRSYPLRAALGYARTGKSPDPHGGERSVLPPELLLYATRHPVGGPVRRG